MHYFVVAFEAVHKHCYIDHIHEDVFVYFQSFPCLCDIKKGVNLGLVLEQLENRTTV